MPGGNGVIADWGIVINLRRRLDRATERIVGFCDSGQCNSTSCTQGIRHAPFQNSQTYFFRLLSQHRMLERRGRGRLCLLAYRAYNYRTVSSVLYPQDDNQALHTTDCAEAYCLPCLINNPACISSLAAFPLKCNGDIPTSSSSSSSSPSTLPAAVGGAASGIGSSVVTMSAIVPLRAQPNFLYNTIFLLVDYLLSQLSPLALFSTQVHKKQLTHTAPVVDVMRRTRDSLWKSKSIYMAIGSINSNGY